MKSHNLFSVPVFNNKYILIYYTHFLICLLQNMLLVFSVLVKRAEIFYMHNEGKGLREFNTHRTTE